MRPERWAEPRPAEGKDGVRQWTGWCERGGRGRVVATRSSWLRCGEYGGEGGRRRGRCEAKIKVCPQVGGVAKMAEPDSQPCLGHGIKASLGLTPLQGWRGERRRPLGLWLKQPGDGVPFTGLWRKSSLGGGDRLREAPHIQ